MNKKSHNNSKAEWEQYREQELKRIAPALKKGGITLDETQVHVGGERYLMSGKKLVLTGKHEDKGRVIVKVSSSEKGKKEIESERRCRDILKSINFAYQDFFLPEELLYDKKNGCLLSITSYIEQDEHFIDRPLKEQFFLALRALEAQEGVHATAYSHTKAIENTFGIMNAASYLKKFSEYKNDSLHKDPKNKDLTSTFHKAEQFLKQGKTVIERYSGFLTHSDFVPHNIRISDRDIYLLDHTSIYFGNKYESWARFINFMVHHNPELEEALSSYVQANRGEEEYLSLRLMRVYKLGFLLNYYAGTLEKTTGDMHKLMRVRLTFWTEVLKAVLNDKQVDKETLTEFLEQQDILRSDEERARRKEIISVRK